MARLYRKNCLSTFEHSEAKYEMIEKLIDIGEDGNDIFIQVEWSGLPDKKDQTWNSVKDLNQDIPEKLKEFLNTTKKEKLACKAKAMLSKH